MKFLGGLSKGSIIPAIVIIVVGGVFVGLILSIKVENKAPVPKRMIWKAKIKPPRVEEFEESQGGYPSESAKAVPGSKGDKPVIKGIRERRILKRLDERDRAAKEAKKITRKVAPTKKVSPKKAKKAPLGKTLKKKKAVSAKMGIASPWAVHLASFLAKKDADALAKKIRADGDNAYVAEVDFKNKHWYRVRVGFFLTKEDALEKSKTLGLKFNAKDAYPVLPPKGEIRLNIHTNKETTPKKKLVEKALEEKRAAQALIKIDKPWVVNLASYLMRSEAEAITKKVRVDGYNVYIAEFDLNGKQWHRVRVGFFSTKEEASESAVALSKKFNAKGAWPVLPPKDEIRLNIQK